MAAAVSAMGLEGRAVGVMGQLIGVWRAVTGRFRTCAFGKGRAHA